MEGDIPGQQDEGPEEKATHVERKYGRYAGDYAEARADAARQMDNPQSAEWEQVKEILEGENED